MSSKGQSSAFFFFFSSSSHFFFLKLKNFTHAKKTYFDLNVTIIWVSMTCHTSSRDIGMTGREHFMRFILLNKNLVSLNCHSFISEFPHSLENLN